MATTLIDNRHNGADIKRCTDQQRMFCLHMMSDLEYRPTEAAKAAGAKNPKLQANRWMKMPHVKAILGKFKREREERVELTSDDVWRYIIRVLDFDPADVFEDAGNNWWYIKNIHDIPKKIRQLIEGFDIDEIQVGDKKITKVKVKFISKTTVLGYAVKQAIPQEVNVNLRDTLDWGAMYEQDRSNKPDLIEQQILDVSKEQSDE